MSLQTRRRFFLSEILSFFFFSSVLDKGGEREKITLAFFSPLSFF